MKAIITGSTGMVGKGVLLECIDDPEIDTILLVNRSPAGIRHSKVKEVLVKDFFELESLREHLADIDACFFCLGVSSVGMNEKDYTKVMYELPLHFAKELLVANPHLTFCFVSGAGTNSTEQGKSMWARVKGRAENDILKLGVKNAYMFRPAFIQPMRGIRSRTKWYNAIYLITIPLHFLLRKMPKYVTDTTTLAQAMIRVAKNGYPKTILESEDINMAGR
jgi:uncharacterized protein YbjT (DUF2867 family)